MEQGEKWEPCDLIVDLYRKAFIGMRKSSNKIVLDLISFESDLGKAMLKDWLASLNPGFRQEILDLIS